MESKLVPEEQLTAGKGMRTSTTHVNILYSSFRNVHSVFRKKFRNYILLFAGNCDKSKGGVDSMDRHCATCAILIPSDQVKKCGKCGRRAYCSRECQKIDWKIKNGDDGKREN